jgi:hypothetical protein
MVPHNESAWAARKPWRTALSESISIACFTNDDSFLLT